MDSASFFVFCTGGNVAIPDFWVGIAHFFSQSQENRLESRTFF